MKVYNPEPTLRPEGRLKIIKLRKEII